MVEMFNYMFKDNKFIEKAGVYFVLSTISSFLFAYGGTLINAKDTTGIMYTLLALFVLFFTNGYCMCCIKAINEQKENYVLPFFSFEKNFITGLKYLIAVIIFLIAVAIIAFLFDFGFAIIGTLLKSKLLATFLISFFTFFMLILIIYYNLAFFKIFATTGSLTSFIQVVKAEQMIGKDRKHYLINTGIFILTSVLALLAAVIISSIEALIIPSSAPEYIKYALSTATGTFIGTYIMFVFAYLTAKSTKEEV